MSNLSIEEINKRLESLNNRVIKKERTLIFNFNTIYNDSYFFLNYYMKWYKNKLICERGINFKEFSDDELKSFISDSPFFNPLSNWIDENDDPDSIDNISDWFGISERLLNILYQDQRSELFSAIKTFYDIGSLKVIGPKRSEHNVRDLGVYSDLLSEKCSLKELFDPQFVLNKIEEYGATCIIHPYIDTILALSSSCYDKTFMFPMLGYNYISGITDIREVRNLTGMEMNKIDYGNEFIEFWPFDIGPNAIGYGYSIDNTVFTMTEYLKERLKELEVIKDDE